MFEISKVNNVSNEFIISFYSTRRFNLTICKDVRDQLVKFLEIPQSRVTLNLTGINFIDSSAFLVIKEAMEIADRHKSELYVSNLSEDVKDLIKLMELEQTLKVLQ